MQDLISSYAEGRIRLSERRAVKNAAIWRGKMKEVQSKMTIGSSFRQTEAGPPAAILAGSQSLDKTAQNKCIYSVEISICIYTYIACSCP